MKRFDDGKNGLREQKWTRVKKGAKEFLNLSERGDEEDSVAFGKRKSFSASEVNSVAGQDEGSGFGRLQEFSDSDGGDGIFGEVAGDDGDVGVFSAMGQFTRHGERTIFGAGVETDTLERWEFVFEGVWEVVFDGFDHGEMLGDIIGDFDFGREGVGVAANDRDCATFLFGKVPA